MLLAQDIRPLPRSPQQRFVTIAIVASLHVVLIAVILYSLNRSLPLPPIDLTLRPIDPVKQTQPPPRPHDPPLQDPQQVFVPKPDIMIADPSPRTVITDPTPTQPAPHVDAVRTFPPQGIMGSHTTPDYPPIEKRLGHEGNVLLKLTIDEWGAVTSAQVERSSGYEGLDRAAADWVKTHWLYHPATRAGDPIPSTTEALVTFRLTDR